MMWMPVDGIHQVSGGATVDGFGLVVDAGGGMRPSDVATQSVG